jgi:hypothetical protein
MSEINGIIPSQSFELVRDQIGAILFTEFDKQAELTYNPDLEVEVWVERFVPFDRKELPAINVMLATGNYDGDTVAQSDGTYTYLIDFHARAKTNNDGKGDNLALLKLQKMIGIARAIIMNPKYRTLGFAAPFVMSRRVTGFEIANPDSANADSVVWGRMKVVVQVPETTELIDASLIEGFDTTVELEYSEKGYGGENSPVADRTWDYTFDDTFGDGDRVFTDQFDESFD